MDKLAAITVPLVPLQLREIILWPADNLNQSPPNAPQGGSVIGNFEPVLPKPKNNKKKKLLFATGGAVVLILATAGFAFGYYVPNKPDNVYRTGLNRSGEAINQLILKSTETDKLQQIQKSEVEGSLEITSNDFNASGTFNAKLDSTKSDSSLDVKFSEKDKKEQAFGLKLLTELQDGKRFPNLYFQLTGIKAVEELNSFDLGFSEYDGKWIAVDAAYLESLSGAFLPPEEKKNKENVTAEEIAELIRSISEVNNEYLFSTDPSKAVLENRAYLGKEKTEEGVNAFHYKVGINKANSVAYCKAISDKFLSSRAYKKFIDATDEEIANQKKSSIEDCDKSAGDVNPDDTFEMWIDAKYKVVHKIRIYSEQNKTDEYTDIGQIYTGGDKLSFFAKYHQDKDNLNVKFTVDADTKELNSKAELTATQEGNDSFNGKASLSAKTYDGEINTEKPKGAIPISKILAKFGFDPSYQSGITQSPSAQQQKLKRCSAAYEARANNKGRGEIPAECEQF